MLWVLALLAAAIPWTGAGATATPVDISVDADRVRLVEQFSLLEDPDASLQADDALASKAWQPVTRGDLSQGFTRSVLWLKVELYNGGNDSETRWLAVGPPRLEDIRLYTAVPGQPGLRERYRSGTSRPLRDRAIAIPLSVFPITLAPGAHRLVLIRIQSRTAMLTTVQMWRPLAYWKSERNGTMLHMLLDGILLTLAVFSIALSIVWRDRVFVVLAAGIIMEVLYVLAYEGYVYQLVLRQGGDLVARLPSIFGNLTVALFSITVMWFAGLDKVAAWKWIYRALIAAMLAGAVWTAVGDYRIGAAVTLKGVFLCNIVWIASMLDGWRRKLPNARLMLIAFSPDLATLFLRLAAMEGLLSARWSLGSSSQVWDSVSMLLLMLFIIGGRCRQVYRAQRQATQELQDTRARERERLEHAVKIRTGELQQALIAADEANRAKGDFLARVSHDLRTPLTSIIGFADIIRASGQEHADQGRIIRRNADHMLGLVNDLIDYAGGNNASALHTEAVYVHALLDAVGQNAATLAARNGNRFRTAIIGDLPPVVELDGKRVQQVLGNLLDNATKFTRDGDISLTAECRSRETDGVLVLSLCVSDNGCGISPEDQARIFEPFARAEASRHQPGVGLGLAIVRQWVSRMEGVIHVTSTPGKGTAIRIDIPVRAADEADVGAVRLAEPADTLPAIDGSGFRILVAEDTAEIRRLLQDDLVGLGFDVETAADGAAAIERLTARDRPGPDLVLTDHSMPGANGDAVLAAARRHHAGVPVVALSATPRRARRATAPDMTLDYDADLLKPVSLLDLRNTVARVLGLAEKAGAAYAAAIPRPSDGALMEARQLVELGAVSDLMDWADRLAENEPECESFAAMAGRIARLGDLAQLRSLLTAEPA